MAAASAALDQGGSKQLNYSYQTQSLNMGPINTFLFKTPWQYEDVIVITLPAAICSTILCHSDLEVCVSFQF